MLRATIYVTITAGEETTAKRVIRTYPNALDAGAFKGEASREFAPNPIDFGPIARPWSKL